MGSKCCLLCGVGSVGVNVCVGLFLIGGSQEREMREMFLVL